MSENPYAIDGYGNGMKSVHEIWNEGHAVGKVEGWNEAIEKILDIEPKIIWTKKMVAILKALRKEGGG